MQPVFRAVDVEPLPDLLCVSPPFGTGDVDGAAVAVTAGAATAAVQRVAGARLEAFGKALAIIIAEGAQHRPLDAVGVHRASGPIEPLAELLIHPADHVVLERMAQALGGGGVLPAEVAGRIALNRLTLVDLPQVIVDFVHRTAARRPTPHHALARLLVRVPRGEHGAAAALAQPWRVREGRAE